MANLYQKPIKKTEAQTLMAVVLPMIEAGKTVKLTVTGFSMYPLVSSRRDAVLLAKADTISVGDVPLFQRSDGSFVLHRIVAKKDGAFATMGDYETKKEYPVTEQQILAKAIGFYRKGTYIDCKSFGYRLYCFWWRKTAAIRPFLLKTMAKMAAWKNKKGK